MESESANDQTNCCGNGLRWAARQSDNLDEILTEACRLVSDALGTDLAKVLACHENGTELLVRAGVGWRPGIVGQVTVPQGTSPPPGTLCTPASP